MPVLLGGAVQQHRLADLAKPIMGAMLPLVGLLILSGLDKVFETRLTDTMPSWLVNLTTRH